MSNKDDGKQNTQSAKVLQLGFNISVSGDPDTDFQIVLDDTGQKAVQSTSQNEGHIPSSGILPIKHSKTGTSERELEVNTQEVESIDDTSVKLKSTNDASLRVGQKSESSSSKDSSIINEIKSTLEHFEKFSDHFKDVPRLRGHPAATSTPISDKTNSKSESYLIYPEFRPKRFSHLYDYHYRKNYYFNTPAKPPDLFLKPLPGENLYRTGLYTRYRTDSLRHYVSDSNLNKTSDYKIVCEKPKYDDLISETPGILKKPDSESGDKHSTSSAESVKDIKIYQSGGILIMQNFKENMDAFEKKEISDFSAKLIENCSRLREEVNSFQGGKIRGTGYSSDEGRNSGKVVQFDLSGFESQKSKSGESSLSASKDEKVPSKQPSSDSISDSTRNRDSSPQITPQCQDFPSLSTVENESTISNQLGMSPTYSSTKKLEWDSGADVGYCNSDLSKENLSMIEKYVLSHLSSGTYSDERSVQPDISKFAQVRIASDKLMDEIREERRKEQQEVMILERRGKEKNGARNREVEVIELSDDEPAKNPGAGNSKQGENLKPVNVVPIQKEPRLKQKVESTDKSVNVNTLFENVDLNLSKRNVTSADCRKVDISNKKSPKVRKLKKSKPSPRKITWAPQKRRFSLENLNKNYGLPLYEMGIPKRTYKKVDGNPEIRDIELSREIDEIVIDQRFKIKQNISSGKEIKKAISAPDQDNNEKENKPKRPVSGSSSSNNTVLPNIETRETEKKETLEANKFSDQIIQTVDFDCESVGVQAFESRKSSDFNSRKGDEQQKPREKMENVHLSSKNIQAFGLNASLPKELAHPKETNYSENQNTKSTQFFGGPINSLPNYHSNLITKPGESCSRVPKVLNTKKTGETEMIRLNEENKKNILANDSQKTGSRSSSAKNKENLFSKNSKKSHSSGSQKTKYASSYEKKDNEGSDLKSKKHSSVVDDPDYLHTSDEISSKVLTSEVLKEHGDSIDRHIIQEKYFQSQLIELKKREMVSRSTSVEPQIEGGRAEKECVSVGCQYSSRSRDTTSEEELKDQVPDDDFKEKSKKRSQRTETTDQYDSSQNFMEEELLGTSKSTIQEQITGDSLPSSTQTAHSWIPGVKNPEQDKSGVGRARSFEYLPGHIYESSGNLREELPSETEQNLITSSSSESDSGKHSINEGSKDSEGRNTLILENSTDNSHESDQLKILDENLTQLNLIVSKLWEKEAEVKNLNRSLFLNLWRKNGSGDYIGHTDTLQTEVTRRKDLVEHGKESGDASCELHLPVSNKTKEASTACQTEEKSSSDAEKFYDKRKILEKRISEEKESQIKWIENEIRHLNILRQLLEKQSFSVQRKERHSFASETPSGASKTENEYSNGNLNENYSGPVTPVYGCTISLSKNSHPIENHPASEESSSRGHQENGNAGNSDPVQYGMSVCLKNVAMDALKNFQRVFTIPVGFQIAVKDECSNSEGGNKKIEEINLQSRPSSRNSPPEEIIPCGQDRMPQNDVYTQFPTSRRNSPNRPSTSVQTDFSSGKCNKCRRRSCFCLSLSDRSLRSPSRSSKLSERKDSLRCRFAKEELVEGSKSSSSTDLEILERGSYPVSKLPARVLGKSNSKSSSSGSFSKPQCTHVNECRKHLERGHSAPIKSPVQGIVCENPCKSNDSLTSDKSDNLRFCRCTKVQVEKFSTCSCQIIKIMGSKCSREVGICQYKRRTSKATENQSCQTDQVIIVSKDLVAPPELVTASRAQGVEYITEKKIAIEKKAVLQKAPEEERVSFEKRRSCDEKLEIEEVGVVKRSLEIDAPAKDKTLQGVSCSCTRQIGAAETEGVKTNEKVRKSQDASVKTNVPADSTCTCFEAFQKDGYHIETLREETVEDVNRFETLREKPCEVVGRGRALREGTAEDIAGIEAFINPSQREEMPENDCLEALSKKPVGDVGRFKSLREERDDNHPRHYFLKIEETEVDDSNESLEMKNSLEVITVKVPVKKAGKSKIYNPKGPMSYETIQSSINSRKESPVSCNCCQACGKCNKKSAGYSTSGEHRKTQAERPQSPVRLSGPHPTPMTSSEDIRYQYEIYQPYAERNRSIQEGCHCDASTNSQNSIPKRDIQIEYDSHKKYRSNSNTKSSFYEDGKNQVRQERVQSKACHGADGVQINNEERLCKSQGGRPYYNDDYYNYDKREYKTKSELLKEEKKRKTHKFSLQESLYKNRPDFYNSAERRREIIAQKARERIMKHNNRIECLMSLIHYCNESDRSGSLDGNRIFTTSEMRGQTMKRYKKLPEVTEKVADQKKKEEYRTNKLVADIYSKKLQIEALKGHLNLSNSISVLSTI